MKFRVLIFFIFILGSNKLSLLHAQTMFVREISGTQTAYSFSNISKLTFTPGNLLVHHNGGTNVFVFNNLRYVNFTDLLTSISSTNESAKDAIILFPNPVVDLLIIDQNLTEGEEIKIRITTLDGRIVFHQHVNQTVNGNTCIDVSSLPAGIYICYFSKKDTVRFAKFIKI